MGCPSGPWTVRECSVGSDARNRGGGLGNYVEAGAGRIFFQWSRTPNDKEESVPELQRTGDLRPDTRIMLIQLIPRTLSSLPGQIVVSHTSSTQSFGTPYFKARI